MRRWVGLSSTYCHMTLDYVRLKPEGGEGIKEMSEMATSILRDYYDPILGKSQNDYMLDKYQSARSLKNQMSNGYRYYFAKYCGCNVGFLAFFPRSGGMYISKLYLYRQNRGMGFGRAMIDFVKGETAKEGLKYIELNVNRYNSAVGFYEAMGFSRIKSEDNFIGAGFYMNDYVYRLEL